MRPYVLAESGLFLESSIRPSVILSAGLRLDIFEGWRTLVSGEEISPLCGTTSIQLIVPVDSSVWTEVSRNPLFAALPPGIPVGHLFARPSLRGFKVFSRVVGDRQQDGLGDGVGDAEGFGDFAFFN